MEDKYISVGSKVEVILKSGNAICGTMVDIKFLFLNCLNDENASLESSEFEFFISIEHNRLIYEIPSAYIDKIKVIQAAISKARQKYKIKGYY